MGIIFLPKELELLESFRAQSLRLIQKLFAETFEYDCCEEVEHDKSHNNLVDSKKHLRERRAASLNTLGLKFRV